ncbi:hypothetical protein Tco_1157072 [Tanacetum coccineum]
MNSFYCFNLYADADHAGCQDTRRSTSVCMQYWETDLLAGHQKGRKALRYPLRKLNILLCQAVVLNWQNIFTKALGRERIEFLINKLGMRSFTLETLKQWADEFE